MNYWFRSKVLRYIKSGGGEVLDAVSMDEVDDDEHRCILISHPNDFRKPKYLLALATGTQNT